MREDPRKRYFGLYEEGPVKQTDNAHPALVAQAASVLPTVSDKTLRSNHALVQRFEQLVFSGADVSALLDEKALRQLSIQAKSEEPATLLAYMKSMAPHIDLQHLFPPTQEHLFEQIEHVGASPLLGWSNRPTPFTASRRLEEFGESTEE